MIAPLPTIDGGFRVIACDPPWGFKSNSAARPGRNAMRHYDCMTLPEIKAMPVADVAATDCALFMWITGPFLAIGAHLPIMKAWGFKPSGVCFTWVKLKRSFVPKNANWIDQFEIESHLHMGTGFTTRANAEFVVLGKRGRSVRKDAGVRSTIVSPLREHSRKPDEFYRRVTAYANGPRLELFSRQRRSGWETWGDQSTQFDPPPAIPQFDPTPGAQAQHWSSPLRIAA